MAQKDTIKTTGESGEEDSIKVQKDTAKATGESGSDEPLQSTTTEADTFEDLGIIPQLCEACTALGYKKPTPIQKESIPLAIQGKDLIGLAET